MGAGGLLEWFNIFLIPVLVAGVIVGLVSGLIGGRLAGAVCGLLGGLRPTSRGMGWKTSRG